MEPSLENVRTIYPLNKTKIFTHEEALELVPLLMHISAKTKRDLNLLNSQLGFFKSNSDKAQGIQEKSISHCNLGRTKSDVWEQFLFRFAKFVFQVKKAHTFGNTQRTAFICTKNFLIRFRFSFKGINATDTRTTHPLNFTQDLFS